MLLFCGGLEIVGEGIELRFPEGAITLDPGGRVFHRLRRQAAAVYAAVHFAAQKASRFEDAEVFGDGGERYAERLGEFGDHGFTLCEASEDGAAGRIGKSGESGVESGAPEIFNHMV